MGTRTFADLRTRVGSLGHWNVSNPDSSTYLAADAAAEAGLDEVNLMVLGGDDLPWCEVRASFDLSTDITDSYKLAVPARLLRTRTKSFVYGTTTDGRLLWRSLDWIDAYLGPGWRQSTGTKGTPKYICQVNREWWLAPQPSDAFIAEYGTLYFGYYQGELKTDANLLIPDALFPALVTASLKEGLAQKDDTRQQYYENKWEQKDRMRILSVTPDQGTDERMAGTSLAFDLDQDMESNHIGGVSDSRYDGDDGYY